MRKMSLALRLYLSTVTSPSRLLNALRRTVHDTGSSKPVALSHPEGCGYELINRMDSGMFVSCPPKRFGPMKAKEYDGCQIRAARDEQKERTAERRGGNSNGFDHLFHQGALILQKYKIPPKTTRKLPPRESKRAELSIITPLFIKFLNFGNFPESLM